MEQHNKDQTTNQGASKELMDLFFKPAFIGVGNPITKDDILKSLEQRIKELESEIEALIKEREEFFQNGNYKRKPTKRDVTHWMPKPPVK
jgi:hypothetical protein